MRQHETLCFPRDRLLTSWYRLTCQCRSSGSGACCTICGERWISTALCWTFWCRTAETAQLPSVSSSTYCMGCSTSHGASSRTVCAAMASLSVRSCQMFGIGRAGDSNNRAENSHRPTRRRERQVQRFKSAGQVQRFLSAHAMIYGHFRPRRHLIAAAGYRRVRARAFRTWRQETYVHQAA